MKKIMSCLGKWEKVFCVVLMILCFFIILVHIVGRYVFNYPLFFAEEAARFIFIYLVMIATSTVLRNNEHIYVEYFIGFVPSTVRPYLNILLDLLAFCFLVSIIYTGFALTSHTINDLSPALLIPIGVIYFAAPLSAILMCLTLIVRIVGTVRDLVH